MKAVLSGNEAIARGAWEAGVEVATGYPGTPSSEIIENIENSFGKDIYAEWSTNEKVAMDAAAGAAYSGKRTIITTKQVGMNVLSDSLLYAAYTGAEAGLVVVTADDPGLFSSQNEQDNRWYARLAKVPMLEPADSQECKDYVKLGIELSEKFDIPVVVRTVMRTSHSKSIVTLEERTVSGKEPVPFPRNPDKYNCTAKNATLMHPKLEQKIRDIAAYAETADFNQVTMNGTELGIITSGVLSTYVSEVFPKASMLKLGLTYPLPENLIKDFASKVDRLLVIEELDPVLEEQIKSMGVEVTGKAFFPECYELLPDDLKPIGIEKGLVEASALPVEKYKTPENLPKRSPTFCPGCPHRSTFYLLNKLKLPVAGDIGCYNLGTLPPFEAQHTMGAMGASVGVLHGMSIADLPEKRVCTIGDSTFFHSGLSPLVNMVHNNSQGVVILMDNSITAMTGHQDNPALDWAIRRDRPAPKIELEPLVKAMGVKKVYVANAFDLKDVEKGLKECLDHDGPSVLITRGECIFVRKEPKAAYAVDHDKCIACHKCFKVGCSAIGQSDVLNPKTGKAKSRIDYTLCYGCGVCAQVCPTNAIHQTKQAGGDI